MSADGRNGGGRSGPWGREDIVQPFRLEADHVIGGRIVRLGPTVDAILKQHAYPAPVSRLVGEAVALVTLIGSGMNFIGRLTVQSRGSGPVSMIVADYMSSQEVRGYAAFDEARLAQLGARPSITALLGNGTLAISIDQGAKNDLYQGAVAIEGETLADCAREYLHRSEQVESFLKLAVAEVATATGTSWRAGGLMLQNIPKYKSQFMDEDGEPFRRAPGDPWHDAQVFAATLEDHELTDPRLSPERLLYNFFHEVGVRASLPQSVAFGCTCSEGRVRRILERYTEEDYKTMLEDGKVRVRCEFCSRTYRFLPEELSK